MPSTGLRGPSSWVYRGSWLRAWLFALFLSWGAMNLIALLVERRTEMLLHPGGQYKALYYGDSICLPAVAVAIWYLGQSMSERPGWWRERLWHAFWFAFGLAYGIWWHWVDAHSHFYTRSQMWSPTKLYHDYVVFPLYIYILTSAGIPAMIWSRRGWKARAIIAVLLAAYALLNYYDAIHRPLHGHENFDWGQFWGRFGL